MSANSGRKKSPAATGDLSRPRKFLTTTTGLSMPGMTGYVNSTEIREGLR